MTQYLMGYLIRSSQTSADYRRAQRGASAMYSSSVCFLQQRCASPFSLGFFSPPEALFDCHRLEAFKRDDLRESQLKP